MALESIEINNATRQPSSVPTANTIVNPIPVKRQQQSATLID